MGPEKQTLQYCLLGEAADAAALLLTREEELGDPRLSSRFTSGPAQPFWGLTGIWNITGILQSHCFVQESSIGHSMHSTFPTAALSSELLNILLLVGPGYI